MRLDIEVRSNSPQARDVVGAWFWGIVLQDEVSFAVSTWVACAGKTLPDGVAVIIRRAT